MRLIRPILAACLVAAAAPALAGGNMEPDRVERWNDLAAAIFGDEAKIVPTESVVTLDAPKRALDSALVPIAIATAAEAGVTGLSLIVDENPGPVAAQVRFGPGATRAPSASECASRDTPTCTRWRRWRTARCWRMPSS